MKVLLIGVGGVGEALATIVNQRDPKGEWMEQMVLSDYNLERAKEVAAKLNNPKIFTTEKINARSRDEIIALAKKYQVDLIMNACDPSFNEIIFDTAYDLGCNYMDMAMTLPTPHPEDPYNKSYVKLGDYQFERAKKWEEKGILAFLGMGVEPGMADVFARYAEKHLFDEIEEIGVRDANNLYVEGIEIAFGFSIWTTIEECLNPPAVWEKDKGWYTTEPFSNPETFYFPEGIGNVEVVNVEHEEVMLIPRYIDKGNKKVTFKYGLGDSFIQFLRYLQAVNLDRKDIKIKVGKDCEIAPRDFVEKCAPNPIDIGRKMVGKTCAGTWVKGKKDGLDREVYLYQVADNQECLERLDCQSVVAQTGFNPAIALELLAKGIWKGTGVHGPEFFDPDPFIERMDAYGFPGGIMEMESEYLKNIQANQLTMPVSQAAATKQK